MGTSHSSKKNEDYLEVTQEIDMIEGMTATGHCPTLEEALINYQW